MSSDSRRKHYLDDRDAFIVSTLSLKKTRTVRFILTIYRSARHAAKSRANHWAISASWPLPSRRMCSTGNSFTLQPKLNLYLKYALITPSTYTNTYIVPIRCSVSRYVLAESYSIEI